MTPWFGRKKTDAGTTVLVLDIENGSVGSALVRLTPDRQPKVFGEARILIPIAMARSGTSLQIEVDRALKEATIHASEVAARVRANAATAQLGDVLHIAAFLSPPWGRPDLERGRPFFLDEMSGAIRNRSAQTFGEAPVSLYTSAGLSAFGTRALFDNKPCLACIVSGEVTELLYLDDQGARAHATIPLGSHSLIRTLMTHGNLTEEEALSAARLPFGAGHVQEPSMHAAAHFAEQFKDAASDLLAPGEVSRIRVVASEPIGEWVARAITQGSTLDDLFPNGGEVSAMRPHHLTKHIAAHAAVPDTRLLLGALFVDNRFNQ